MAILSKALNEETAANDQCKDALLGAPPVISRQISGKNSSFAVARTWADQLCPAEWRKLRSLWRVLAPYWLNPSTRRESLWYAFVIVALTFGNAVATVGGIFFNSMFMKAVADKNRRGFYRSLLGHLLNTAWATPCFVFHQYFQARLAVKWREWMTSKFFDRYFHRRRYYEIQAAGNLDNPDQRINDDIRNCTEHAVTTATMVLGAAFDFTLFSTILLSMYPPMFFVLAGVSTVGTRVSLWLGRHLIGLNSTQERHEADFRFALVRLRENAESIAFYQGEQGERELLFQRLRAILKNTDVIQAVTRNLGYFTVLYGHMVAFIPYLVSANAYFQGGIDFAFVNQCSEVFTKVNMDTSLVITQLSRFADLYTTAERLDEFVDVLDAEPVAGGVQRSSAEQPTLLGVDSLSVETPDKRVLFSDLSFDIASGESMLIMGPSGCGKTSLMRALAGLWDVGSGTVRCSLPAAGGSQFFLPQRPYMVLGSLREQMLYPTWSSHSPYSGAAPVPSEAQLRVALEAVRLAHLLQRQDGLEAVADWSAVLSLGEQQRLALTRVLLSRPTLALLDECTSALDAESEARLYTLLKESGTTYVSVSHRSTLKGFHTKLLQFSDDADGKAVVSSQLA